MISSECLKACKNDAVHRRVYRRLQLFHTFPPSYVQFSVIWKNMMKQAAVCVFHWHINDQTLNRRRVHLCVCVQHMFDILRCSHAFFCPVAFCPLISSRPLLLFLPVCPSDPRGALTFSKKNTPHKHRKSKNIEEHRPQRNTAHILPLLNIKRKL